MDGYLETFSAGSSTKLKLHWSWKFSIGLLACTHVVISYFDLLLLIWKNLMFFLHVVQNSVCVIEKLFNSYDC
jgi:hypothetical protein